MAPLLHHLDLQGPVLEGPSTIDHPPDATRRDPRPRPARHRRRSPRRRLDRGCRSCRRPPPGPPAPGQEAGVRRRLPARPPRAAGRRDEVLNGLWLLPAKKIRLMIQIPAFLEILISCFLISNQVGFS